PRGEPFVLLAGDMPTKDLFDGVDVTWNRVPGGAEIARAVDEEIAKFNAQDAPGRVHALLVIRRRLAALPADLLVSDKREQLDRIIESCLGLEVDTVPYRAGVAPGAGLMLRPPSVVPSVGPVRSADVLQ